MTAPRAPSAADRRDPEAGFTLVEMLVALALFSAIGLAGFTVLDTVIETRGRTEGRMERMAEIDRALILISRDLAQKRPGPVAGDAAGIAFRGSGALGPTAVRWALEDGVLMRRIAREGEPGRDVEQRVLAEVGEARWRFLDAERVWHDAWPPEGAPPDAWPIEGAPIELRAVRLEIVPLDGGRGASGAASRLVELPRQAAM